MRLLSELSRVLNRYCVKEVNVIGHSSVSTDGDLIDKFYDTLQDNPGIEADAIAEILYGPGTRSTSNRFKKLKQRLIRRMSNTLFFIDTKDNQYSDLQRAYYLTHREYALASILAGRTASFAAKYFYQRVFRRAKRYELVPMLLLSAERMRYFSGIVDRDNKKYLRYHKIHEEALRLYEAEATANQFYIETVVNYGVSNQHRQATFEQTTRFLQELDERFGDLPMLYNYAFRYYLLDLLRWSTVSEFEKLLAVTEKALDYFRGKPFKTGVPQSYFLMYQLIAYIQLREFEKGVAVHHEAINLVESGLHNWFKLNELSFKLAMHTGNYAEAWRIYVETAGHHNFTSQVRNIQETWRLNRAYLYYLASVGRLATNEKEDPLGKFRIMKFINNVPKFSKEKRGMNIPILVLQILFTVSRRQYDLAIDRIEAIEKYCSRYVRRDEHFRSNCFIKILLQFPLAAFHKKGVQRKAQRYVKMLDSQPPALADQSYEIEVIPYDELWTLAFASLEAKFHRPSVRRYARQH